MPRACDGPRYSQRGTASPCAYRWRDRSERRPGNADNASGNAAGADVYAEPIAKQRSTSAPARGPRCRPRDTSPLETQSETRSLLQKTQRLTYDADVFAHLSVLPNPCSPVQQ